MTTIEVITDLIFGIIISLGIGLVVHVLIKPPKK